MITGWRRAGRRDMAELLAFLLRDEISRVGFSSRMKKARKSHFYYVNRPEEGPVKEAILLSEFGLLLPVLDARDGMSPGLGSLLSDLPVRVASLMGTSASVLAAEELLGMQPSTAIDYHLMAIGRTEFDLGRAARETTARIPPEPPLLVRRAVADDMERLYPLQKGYEIEEVALRPELFHEANCRGLLKRCLKEEIIHFAERGGVAVSKAQTNSRGYTVDQIGGVYTRPEDRGQGIARAVLFSLLEELFRQKEGVCLFVKKTNTPAQALYRRMGFHEKGDFRISYYGI